MAQQKKARPVGRPKLPKGAAKGRIVPVRFAPDDLRIVTKAARQANQNLSEWIRNIAKEVAINAELSRQLIEKTADLRQESRELREYIQERKLDARD